MDFFLCGAPSLTRSFVCGFQFFLGIANAVFLGSEFHEIHEHIPFSLFLRLSQPGGPSSCIYFTQEESIPVMAPGIGTGLQYLHCSSVSRKRRRKGNPVPGGITGPPCSWGHKYGSMVVQVGGVSEETEIYGNASCKTLTSESLHCKLQTGPLFWVGAMHGKTRTCQTNSHRVTLWLTVSQSVSQYVLVSSQLCGRLTRYCFLFKSWGLEFVVQSVRRPPWREAEIHTVAISRL
jgi:hypothetical protein